MKNFLLLGLFGVLLFGWPQAARSAEPEAAKPGPATYVGNEICKACHPTQFEKFSQTMMGKIFLYNARNEEEKRACESCHGPGSNHVAAGGGRGVGGLITFRKDSGESAKVQNEACLGCHQRGVQTYWAASPHAGRGLTCVTCHTLMEKTSDRYQLVKVGEKTPFFNRRAEIEVCGQCHLQRQAQLYRSSHMPLSEGKLVCTNCHNPHGTVNDRLLKVTDPRLCTQCHMSVQHPVNPRPPTSVFFFNRSCTNCHSQIHGSNHPSGQFFQR